MEEGGFGDLINVGEEREGGVENDAKVADAGVQLSYSSCTNNISSIYPKGYM